MSDAFLKDWIDRPICKARRPHLRDYDEAGCKAPNGQDMRMEPMLQGASNSWFGITLSALAIPPKHASFFISHGDTDVVHARELTEVIERASLSPSEWGWMTHAATVGGHLYRAMYDHEAFA